MRLTCEDEMSERTKRWLRQLGPGLITGAADDDPSGIATYSQAGAQFGYQLGWTLALTYPLMVGIQMVSARMGRVTGQGLAANIRRRFPRPVLYLVVAMLVVANTLNIAADIAAMGEALRLVVGGKMLAWAILFGACAWACNVPELPGLHPLPEVADARAACLRGGCFHHRGAVA
jgi:NRAMP (natural resistance-associated macrophage protein)-like metal ion transporter